MKQVILMMLLFSTCSTIDEGLFFQQAIGQYNLNATGVGFLLRETGRTFNEGIMLEFRGNGVLLAILNETNSENIAQMVELKKANQGLFQLENTNKFVAMGFSGGLWISTTNGASSPEKVLFEHLVPIATKIQETTF
ncbi:MAG: hypothetical protein ACRCWI_03435 [Brevinema sp.]